MSAPFCGAVHHELRAQADGSDLALFAGPFENGIIPLDPVVVPLVRQTMQHVDFDVVGAQGSKTVLDPFYEALLLGACRLLFESPFRDEVV